MVSEQGFLLSCIIGGGVSIGVLYGLLLLYEKYLNQKESSKFNKELEKRDKSIKDLMKLLDGCIEKSVPKKCKKEKK